MTDHITTTTDTLSAIWQSTAALYAAHGLDAVSVPPSKRRKYFAEEADELKEASSKFSFYKTILQMQGDNDFAELGHDLTDEAADVLVTVCGLLQAHGLTLDDLRAGIERKTAINNAKREPGWAYSSGKIRKVEGK